MHTVKEREDLFRKIYSFLKKHGATKVSVFGSYVRGEEKPESDIDVLVEFAERKSLLTLVNRPSAEVHKNVTYFLNMTTA